MEIFKDKDVVAQFIGRPGLMNQATTEMPGIEEKSVLGQVQESKLVTCADENRY